MDTFVIESLCFHPNIGGLAGDAFIVTMFVFTFLELLRDWQLAQRLRDEQHSALHVRSPSGELVDLSIGNYADDIAKRYVHMLPSTCKTAAAAVKLLHDQVVHVQSIANEKLDEILKAANYYQNTSKLVSLFCLAGLGSSTALRWLRADGVDMVEDARYLGGRLHVRGLSNTEVARAKMSMRK